MVLNKVNGGFGVLRFGFLPHCGDCFELRVEVETGTAVEVQIAVEGAPRAGEGVHREWHWNWHVNTDLCVEAGD